MTPPVALCETLNFSETARRLGLSQPALSKAVRKLEDEIGGTLIRREGTRTHLTHLGRLMQEQLKKVDETVQRAELTAQRLVNGETPQVQIAVMCTIGPTRFQAFLRQWCKENPGVEVVLRNADRDKINEMLISGFVDCALVGATLKMNRALNILNFTAKTWSSVSAPIIGSIGKIQSHWNRSHRNYIWTG